MQKNKHISKARMARIMTEDANFRVDGQAQNEKGIGLSDMAKWDCLTHREANGKIISTFLLDISGLKSKDTVGDVIGNAAGGVAYLTQVTTAVNGLVYHIEIICVETPAVSSGNNTDDIDLALGANGTKVYNNAHGGSLLVETGAAWAAGDARGTDVSAISLIDGYLYLTSGEDAGDVGIYNAGKFIIRLHGLDPSTPSPLDF